MSAEALVITPNLGDAQVTAADAARLERDELVLRAAVITTVTDRIDADHATNVLRDLTAFSKRIEAARAEAKAPALDLGRRIDALAKELAHTVATEAARVSRVVGAFEAEERRKAEAARIAAEAEAARIRYDAERKANEARRLAGNQVEGEKAADLVRDQAVEQIVAVRQAAAVAVAPKQAGTAVREDVCFEVLDIRALYAAHPELVNMEPNGTAIRAILRNAPNLQVPGLRHWREAKLNVR
jgi:hypothetical protein